MRKEMSALLASSSTRRSSIGRPSRSYIENATVPPRPSSTARPVDLHQPPAIFVAEALEGIE